MALKNLPPCSRWSWNWVEGPTLADRIAQGSDTLERPLPDHESKLRKRSNMLTTADRAPGFETCEHKNKSRMAQSKFWILVWLKALFR